MKQVVSAKAVLTGVPQRQLLELRLQFRKAYLRNAQESALSQIGAEAGLRG